MSNYRTPNQKPSGVDPQQRHSAAYPCPVCGGYDSLPRGQSQRCSGFISEDGQFAFCTREGHAGGLTLNNNTERESYKHRLDGPCKCGRDHHRDGANHANGASHLKRTKVIATHTYCDERGHALFRIERTEPKGFVALHPEREGALEHWVPGINGVRRVLYRLPELLKADPKKLVFVVEGEKDADRVASLGFVSTTNPFGAGKWEATFSECLRDRCVVILADNDAKGREHAEQVARSLRAVKAKVKVVTLPDLPPGGDVSDWLEPGRTKADLIHAIKEAPSRSAQMAPEPLRHDSPAESFSIKYVQELSDSQNTADWVWDTYIARRRLTVLTGIWKSGKTTLLMHMLKALKSTTGSSAINR